MQMHYQPMDRLTDPQMDKRTGVKICQANETGLRESLVGELMDYGQRDGHRTDT